jgi:putative transposon-encoded protein
MARSVKIEVETELHLKRLRGFLVRKVTRFGNGAKVDCPKEYLGKTVYLVIIDDP